jgi:hypothetical protein
VVGESTVAVDWPSFIGQVLVTAVATSGLTLGGQVFVARYQRRRTLERDRIQHEREVERARVQALLPRVTALKGTAGYLATHLGGYGITQRADELVPRYRELDSYVGQFAEYADVQRAIWGLQNTTGWILHEEGIFLTTEQWEVRQRRAVLAPPETPE